MGATDPAVRDVGVLLYRRLLRLDSQAFPAADLATDYTISQDGLTYHLALPGGQLWSDGRAITAADVVATVNWVQSAKFGDDATAAPWRDVHVRAVGDGVTFDLAGPRASFAAQLTQLPILPLGMLSTAQLSAVTSKPTSAMPTSGPLRVVSATATSITLFPNPHAARGVHLNQVAIDLFSSFADAAAAFRSRSVDAVVANDPSQRAQLIVAGGISHDITTFRFVDLLFNQRVPVMADPAVRQAVAASIDRSLLVSGPLRGMAMAEVGAIPAGVVWAAPHQAIPARDLTAAAAALTADGWTLGPDGVRVRGTARLHLGLVVADVAPLPEMAASLARQLSATGIDVAVSPLPAADLTRLLVGGGKYDMALADWDSGPDPDVSSFWRSTAVPPAGFNVGGGQVDPFLDQALDRLATLTTTSARVAAALAVTSQLNDDLPALFLETPQVSLVVRPGISVLIPPVGYSSARFDDIAGWHRG
ncbi:MAG: ABC transporter substrate-binding protein [Candidatus Dormibacter sp.]